MIYASCNENAQCVHMVRLKLKLKRKLKKKCENYMNVYLMDTYLDVCVF